MKKANDAGKYCLLGHFLAVKFKEVKKVVTRFSFGQGHGCASSASGRIRLETSSIVM
jgi:hypothetical protein